MAKLKIKTKKELKQRNLQTYKETTKAALAVQRWYRGYVARKEVNRVRNATIKLQAGARGMLSRKQMRYENEMAAKIQCLYRGHRARRRVNEKIQDQTADLAATMVQARMRAMIQRRRLRKTLGCAVQIQAAWRGYYVRRRFREEYDRKAQIIIQSRMFESKKVQWYLERERQVMRGKIAVFREWAHSAGKRRALARQRDAAAVAVQRTFRGYLARRERARLHDERQRGKELGKFVELLRSHMSMVIFEEKERHAVAFPVRGGKGRDNGAGTARRSPRETASTLDQPHSGGRRHGASVQQRDSWDNRGNSSRENSGIGAGGRRRAGRQVQRIASNPSFHSSARGRNRGRSGSRPSSSGRRSATLSHGQPRSGGRRSVEPLPDILPDNRSGGGGAAIMRKAELEDALALADLLNLPAGGGGSGGGGGGGGRRQSGKPKAYGGGGARRGSGRTGRPPQRAMGAAADGW